MRIIYVLFLLFAASPILAQTNPFVIKPGFVIVPSPLPQMPVEVECHEDHGWTDAGNGYQRHTSGYLFHPAIGVHYPQSAAIPQPIPMYSPFGFQGGFGGNYGGFFGGNCGPSG